MLWWAMFLNTKIWPDVLTVSGMFLSYEIIFYEMQLHGLAAFSPLVYKSNRNLTTQRRLRSQEKDVLWELRYDEGIRMISIINTYNLGHSKGILCTFQSENVTPGFRDHLLSNFYSTRFPNLVNIANKQNCKF